ncbi:hypothetical protein DACRYDRAFT_24732 [Dacryopinax primogenitus]|uniref:HMG box domain-containing protein n=1 Tax=Dacryopinax primogenitus (strain DJM 731) TaxID=1858805 RepID=M5FP71_DACPD|nr:uncharacterized protein DACRYDRAFT_24732 [Dacryopinax primogenitus]EJT98280.1 hypothetical protein DACRYDRAFT_24732 [Dacryopinax primogenitus]
MYGYGYPYPPAPPMPYPGGPPYYDERYGPSMGYGMPYYYPPPHSGRSDGSYASPLSESPPPRRETINRTKDGEHVPRPRNAFIFFRSHLINSGTIPHSLEPDHRNLSRIAGEMWKKLTAKEREPFNKMADDEKAEHKKKYPNYRYAPAQRTVHHTVLDGNRRKVHRRPEADEQERRRCAEMAELVHKGVSGEALEAAMKGKGHFADPSAPKRKRMRYREPDSDDDDERHPQVAPAYRNSAMSRRREADQNDRQEAQVPNPHYMNPQMVGKAPAPPFYAGRDAPSAFSVTRDEPPATPLDGRLEPFQLLSEQSRPPSANNVQANGKTVSAAPSAPITVLKVEPQAPEDHEASPLSSPSTSAHEPVMSNGDMSYYLRGIAQMDGFLTASG